MSFFNFRHCYHYHYHLSWPNESKRIFSYSQSASGFSVKRLDSRDALWAPFSAIITLLIFTGFRERVVLTNDIILNVALAFSFGFWFDKILEVWQKSPPRTAKDKEST